MSRNRCCPWSINLARFGLVAGSILALFAGLVLVGQPADPAEKPLLSADNVAGVQTTDKLVVLVGLANPGSRKLTGTLNLELLGPDGQSLGRAKQAVNQRDKQSRYRFELPAIKLPPDKVTLRGQFRKQNFEMPLAKVLLVKAHETELTTGVEFVAGSGAALRCSVRGIKSVAATIPLAGARVEVRLRDKDGQQYPLYGGKTGEDGLVRADLKVPAVAEGQYTLEVATRSDLGEEKLQRPVQVKSGAKILLVTDKPLYQPGQVIHIRALTLRPSDLKPVAGNELVFEVEDAKGNKVFKRAQALSDYGVAAADFQLADEVNMGDYHVRAIVGEHQSDKTVAVKRYVLPKFKINLSADKPFYLPKETLHAELQTDYFFGKPVAGAKVHVTASTFDVQFRQFQTWEGKSDASGHATFDIKLPDYFVGQPLQKGNALVRLEAKVTDTADHNETVSRPFTVSDQPIKVSLIPEGGRLVPSMENRVFAAAIYPDGSPAACDVALWIGKEAKGKPFATLKTNEAGLAEFRVTPKSEQFRPGPGEQRSIEMLGGQARMVWMQKQLFDLFAEARDAKGNVARAASEVTSEPFAENVVLRLDKAVYRAGDTLNADIRSSAGVPTAYLDVVRGGQTMLTRWLDVKDGKADYRLDLPADLFGTLEVHAYQTLASGEIVRDSRVVYVQPRDDLKITVKSDKSVHLPGEAGRIRFQVTDAAGNPTAAALGVIVVDESVFALQEMQPGLEKVYFTLQEELLKPQAQVVPQLGTPVDTLVREPQLADAQQQIARVLLTAVKPALPPRWEVAPAIERRRQVENGVQQIGWALYSYALSQPFMERDKKTGRWHFKPDLLQDLVKAQFLQPQMLNDPFGNPISLDSLAALEKSFKVDQLAKAVTYDHMMRLYWAVINYANANKAKWYRDGKWTFPDTMLADAAGQHRLDEKWQRDAWGKLIRLVKRAKKIDHQTGWDQFDYYELVSAGPDGKLGTDDDIKQLTPNRWQMVNFWWLGERARLAQQPMFARGGRGAMLNRAMLRDGAVEQQLGVLEGRTGGFGGGGAPGAVPEAAAAYRNFGPAKPGMADTKGAVAKADAGDKRAGAAPARVREFFPETMLWQPALITDADGQAELPITFADSITTWRLSASASSRGGALGGVTAPLRVFQDFFVDLDLPVTLTQNDEVAFPVAVYNYLKTPQKVQLELQEEPWFTLTDDAGLKRTLDLHPNEVSAVKFRIRAKRIGFFPLTVKATGSKTSDAIKRSIEVVPDGQAIEQVATDRLTGRVAQTIDIPAGALPDASRLTVKVYPGVFSQILEGTDGILRMPGGCFEQTSSSAYPNILVMDYINKNRIATPEIRMKAENYLNVGYQRLLTFERPGGGFDWWGSGEPLVWLSAYGLHEFNDMAKVYPIDRGIIARTQQWLLKQQATDGTWSNIGATHNETIAQMGDPKLLLTSYVAWSLLDSGLRVPQLNQSIDYIRKHIADAQGNAYILALAANALAAFDAKDDATFEAIERLNKLRQEMPKWKACTFPAGQSLTYARGESVTVETTSLAALAMLKSGQFPNTVNQALLYLVKARDPNGTWGSTSATILALKALVAGAAGAKQQGKASFVIRVNGKDAAKGEVTEQNADVLQAFDLKEHLRVGRNDVEIEVQGDTNLMYQVVGRHFEAWQKRPVVEKPMLEVGVEYDRASLSTADLLRAKATLRYHGKLPTYMVIVDLGIPPGFTADAGDFAEMVGKKQVKKFSMTARQVILYLGDVKPGDILTFEYGLKPKYPIKAKTPATVAYEYYTPANRATARPVEIKVVEK
jgi:uncharacterized protein YfaS (alpha-2-macroglobulin family)